MILARFPRHTSRFDRRLLGDLCRCALRALNRYFEMVTGSGLRPGVIAVLQTFGDRINLHVHLHFQSHSFLAAHRLQCPQPGPGQDKTGGRARG
jgi:hypothetical protein